MKIAIIADTHDNVKNTEKLVKVLNKKIKPDLVIHLGDIVSPFMIDILGKLKAPLEIVFGNNDGDIEGLFKKAENYKNINFQKTFAFGEVEADGRKIFFNHFQDFAKEKAIKGKYDLVAYGHNHKKKIEKIRKTFLVNPGEIGGIFHKPTFFVYNTKENKIEIIYLK